MSREIVCGCPLNKELPCGFQVIYGFPDPGMICNLAQMWWTSQFLSFFVFSWVLFHAFRYQTSQRETSPSVQTWCDKFHSKTTQDCSAKHHRSPYIQVPTLCRALDTIFLHCKCQWLQHFSPIPSMQRSYFPCEILSLAATQHWTICHGGTWCGGVLSCARICINSRIFGCLWSLFKLVHSLKALRFQFAGGQFFWGWIIWFLFFFPYWFCFFFRFCFFCFCFLVASCATASSPFCLHKRFPPSLLPAEHIKFLSWKQKPFGILTLMLCEWIKCALKLVSLIFLSGGKQKCCIQPKRDYGLWRRYATAQLPPSASRSLKLQLARPIAEPFTG